jgi:hypothetical protein
VRLRNQVRTYSAALQAWRLGGTDDEHRWAVHSSAGVPPGSDALLCFVSAFADFRITPA